MRALDGPTLLRAVIVTNIAFYLFSILLHAGAVQLSMSPFSFLAPDQNILILLGVTGALPVLRLHRWWTLISANYLHGSLLHLVFNLIALKQIGVLINEEYGTWRTFSIYTLSGVFGFWISCWAGVPLTLGASASVCGLIGAGLYFGKSRGGIYGQEIFATTRGWIIALFIFGLASSGINNWGHGGGIVAGIVLGYLFGYNERRRENFRDKALAWSCILVTVTVLVFSMLSGLAAVLPARG